MELLWDMEDLKHPVSLDMQEEIKEGGQLISLSDQVFMQLLELGLDCNHLWLLENPDFEFKESPKIIGWHQTLVRKGYLDLQGRITGDGLAILESLSSGQIIPFKKKRKEKRVEVTSDFEVWWKEYPATDTFTYKGKSFKGSRALRADKNDCMIKYGVILSRGEYTSQDMVDALKLEKKQKMELSVVDGVNKMKYFSNSKTYLNQRIFESYIDLIRQNPDILKDDLGTQGGKRIDI